MSVFWWSFVHVFYYEERANISRLNREAPDVACARCAHGTEIWLSVPKLSTPTHVGMHWWYKGEMKDEMKDEIVCVGHLILQMLFWKEGCHVAHRGALLCGPGGSLRDEIFFFLLRTALKDRPKGPPTANRQLPSTANRHQPPTTNRQPPTAANRQRRPTANCQPLPTASNHQPPATNRRQPPPTATNCQLPTANRQPPPTANRQLPPTMVEHMECPRAFLGNRNTFFFSR